jgi:hypothetical protein
MPHLPPAHHETSKHDSPNETEMKVKLPKCLGFKFKPRQVNDSLQLNQGNDHLVSHPQHSNDDAAAAHVIANITVESEGESRPSRICLPYWDVHKFCNDGLEARKIPKMLWKMLQELGYEKQPEYFATQVTYEGSEPVWHVQVYIFTPKPLR